MLAGVLFDDEFRVMRAALVPFVVVERRATYVVHTNSSKLMLRDEVWEDVGVEDVTVQLVAAMP